MFDEVTTSQCNPVCGCGTRSTIFRWTFVDFIALFYGQLQLFISTFR